MTSNTKRNNYNDNVDEFEVESGREAISLDNLSSVAVIHSELSQNERQRLVQLLHRGERRVLITTDLLARGLDLPHVGLVINYDLPWGNRAINGNKKNSNISGDNSSNGEMALTKYIHRVGRTGRAGEQGTTVSFLSLPNNLVQRAMRVLNKITQNNNNIKTSNTSEKVELEVPWHDKNDALRRGIVASGTSKETQLDLIEKMELTQPKHRIYGSTSLEDWTQDEDDNDVNNTIDNDDDEDVSNEESLSEDENEGNAENMINGRVHHEGNTTTNKVETITFASDEAILTPL